MQIKTSELTGAALDWAVAKAVGAPVMLLAENNPGERWQVQRVDFPGGPYWPSQDWCQCGPLIEKYGVAVGVLPGLGNIWAADFPMRSELKARFALSPLKAACLALVAAKLGDTVDVPEELSHV